MMKIVSELLHYMTFSTKLRSKGQWSQIYAHDEICLFAK